MKVDIKNRGSAMKLFKVHGVKSYANQIVACAKKKGTIIEPFHVYNFFTKEIDTHGQLIMDCAYDLIRAAKAAREKNIETISQLNGNKK